MFFKNKLALSMALMVSASSLSMIVSADPLQDAVQKAVVSNPEVQARWHAFRASEEAQSVARGGYLPRIDATGHIGQEWRERPGTSDVDFTRHGGSLSLNQMVYDGFATRDEVARLGHVKRARYFELLGASEEAALETLRAYADVLRYRELVALAEANLAEHQRVYAQVQQRASAGVGPRADLEQASGRLALAQSNLYVEVSNLHDVSARYLRVVGDLPPDALIPVSVPVEKVPTTIGEALTQAYQTSPSFNAALANVKAAEADLEVRKAAYHPRLDLRARHDVGKNLDDISGQHTDQVVELVLSYNLYKGGSDAAARRQYREQQHTAEYLREKECRDVRQTVSIAHNDAQRLSQQLAVLDRHQKSIENVRQAARQQFEIGQRTLLDLLDTENEYFQARRAYINAAYDAKIAQARTLTGMGTLLAALGVSRDGMPSADSVGGAPGATSAASLCPLDAPKRPDYAPMSQVPAPQVAPADVTLDTSTYFTVNGTALNEGARRQLDALALRLRNNGNLERVQVIGHTDSTGSVELNRDLAERRAAAVKTYLVEKGVPARLIEARGRGLHEPAADNASVPGRAQNRRVETSVQTK